MAEKNLVQHIDKISYAVAGVVGLALLVLPIIYGGDVNETRESLNRAAGELKRKKQEQPFPALPDRGLKDAIQTQWRPGSGGESPTWITGAPPALVKRVQSIKQRPARHSPGVITEISAHRDSQKKQVYLIVKGAMGADNEYVTIDRVELLRREGASGSFSPVATFKGNFEYRDERVTAGETYAYKFTTVASRVATAPSNILPPKATEQESAEVETPPIPYDFSVKVRQTISPRQLGERPTVMASFRYWDYEDGELAGDDRGTYPEKKVIGNRYQIFTVDPDKRSILVKDAERRTRHEISSKDDAFPVELWAPVSGAAVETPSGGADAEEEGVVEEEEVEADPEPEPEAEAPAPRSGGRRRRGF